MARPVSGENDFDYGSYDMVCQRGDGALLQFQPVHQAIGDSARPVTILAFVEPGAILRFGHS